MARSPLLPIFLTIFIDVFGLTLMLPLLPFYGLHFHAAPIVVTTLLASYAACQLVSGPILGRLSDRVGRKPVLIVSQLGTVCGFLLIARADSVDPSLGLAFLFAGRIVDGLTAGNLSIAQAYISDVTRPEDRTHAFALMGIAFGSGFLFGPPLSGELTHHFGFSAPAYMAVVLSCTSVVLSSTLLPAKDELDRIKAKVRSEAGAPPSAPPSAAAAQLANRGNLGPAHFLSQALPRRRLLQLFAFTTSFAVLTGGLGLFLDARFGYTAREAGWVYGVSGLVGGMIQGGAIRPLVKRLGEAKLAVIGFMTMVVAYPFLGLAGAARSVPLLLAVVAVSSFGVAVVRPCLTTLITKSVSHREQGAVLGTSQSLSSVSQIVGPEAAGMLIQHQQFGAYGLTAALVAVVGMLLTLRPEPAAAPGVADSA